MKKLLFLISAFILISGCNQLSNDSKPIIWEYKTLTFNTSEQLYFLTSYNSLNDQQREPTINFFDYQVNELGSEGWELVDSYLESNSFFVNIGDSRSNDKVNSIKEKSAPYKLILIFKRPK